MQTKVQTAAANVDNAKWGDEDEIDIDADELLMADASDVPAS